jgi:hypothetical protein
VSTLRDIAVAFKPTNIRVQDWTGASAYDHSDHVHAARFMELAQRSYTRPHALTSYRAYEISEESANVSDADFAIKRSAFLAYASNDSLLCSSPCTQAPTNYADWLRRQYRVSDRGSKHAKALVSLGKCVAVRDGDSGDGTPLVLADCDDVAAQRWQLTSNGELRGLADKCVDVRGADPSNGTVVQLYRCVDVPQQKWILTREGELRGLDGKCLDVRGGWRENGTPIQIYDCADVPQQKWRVF